MPHSETPSLPWYSIAEVADHYGVHANTVRSWITSGRLHAHKLGRIVRISERDLAAFEATELAPMGVQGHLLRRKQSKAAPSSARRKRTQKKGGRHG